MNLLRHCPGIFFHVALVVKVFDTTLLILHLRDGKRTHPQKKNKKKRRLLVRVSGKEHSWCMGEDDLDNRAVVELIVTNWLLITKGASRSVASVQKGGGYKSLKLLIVYVHIYQSNEKRRRRKSRRRSYRKV